MRRIRVKRRADCVPDYVTPEIKRLREEITALKLNRIADARDANMIKNQFERLKDNYQLLSRKKDLISRVLNQCAEFLRIGDAESYQRYLKWKNDNL